MNLSFSEDCSGCLVKKLGTVISTSSKEFPHILFVGLKHPLYLFPKSLYFSEHRRDLTKSQKARSLIMLSTGDQIYFLANRNNLILAYQKSIKTDRAVFYAESKILIQDSVIISPSYPRRCWSCWLSCCVYVNPATNILQAVPNIAYDSFISVDAYLTPPENGGCRPVPHITFELGHLVRPVPNNRFLEVIFRVEWNLPDRRKWYDVFPENDNENDELVKSRRKVRPYPPKPFRLGVTLYAMDNRRLVWPQKPYYEVVMGALPSNNERRALVDGRSIRADMFFCKYNNFYVVYKRVMIEKSNPLFQEYPQFLTRKRLGDEFAGYTEYYVLLTHSNFVGYYASIDLRNCLIDDPDLLLFNHAHVSIDVNFPVWVRLNDFGRPARFSVTALAEPLSSLASVEMPILEGRALVANVCTGSVYCYQFPNLRFLLQYSDRADLQTGEHIMFRAVFSPAQRAYIIIQSKPIPSEFPIKAISCPRGYLFSDKISCTTVKASRNLYNGSWFGLITDTEEIVRGKAIAENREIPTTTNVFVVENCDANRATFFNIYCPFTSSTKELEAIEQPQRNVPIKPWWDNIDEFVELTVICEDVCRMGVEHADEFNDELRDCIELLQETSTL